MYQCKYCNRECKAIGGLKRHQSRCKLNPDPVPRFAFFDSDEYKNKQRLIREKNNKIYTSEEHRTKCGIASKKRFDNPAFREAFSVRMKQAVLDNPDSYSKKNVSGRVKMIEYNGNTYKGMWECVFAKYLTENNIKFLQPSSPFPYEFEGKWHLYFPDFYLEDLNVYVEVKGYERPRDLAKWNSVENLIVVKQKHIDLIKSGNYSIFDQEFWR